MEQKSFREKNAWFIRFLMFLLWVTVSAFGSYLFHRYMLPKANAYAVFASIWWFVLVVVITRIKPQDKTGGHKVLAYIWRVIAYLLNFLLFAIACCIEIQYLGISLWWCVIPGVLWIGIITLIAFGNHKKNHPREEIAGDNTDGPDPSDQNSLRDVHVTRELMMELGLPVRSGAYMNLADFENSLELAVKARLTEAQAHKVESIITALNAHAIPPDEAAQVIQETLGLRKTETTVAEEQSLPKVVSSNEATTQNWKGWKSW